MRHPHPRALGQRAVRGREARRSIEASRIVHSQSALRERRGQNSTGEDEHRDNQQALGNHRKTVQVGRPNPQISGREVKLEVSSESETRAVSRSHGLERSKLEREAEFE